MFCESLWRKIKGQQQPTMWNWGLVPRTSVLGLALSITSEGRVQALLLVSWTGELMHRVYNIIVYICRSLHIKSYHWCPGIKCKIKHDNHVLITVHHTSGIMSLSDATKVHLQICLLSNFISVLTGWISVVWSGFSSSTLAELVFRVIKVSMRLRHILSVELWKLAVELFLGECWASDTNIVQLWFMTLLWSSWHLKTHYCKLTGRCLVIASVCDCYTSSLAPTLNQSRSRIHQENRD